MPLISLNFCLTCNMFTKNAFVALLVIATGYKSMIFCMRSVVVQLIGLIEAAVSLLVYLCRCLLGLCCMYMFVPAQVCVKVVRNCLPLTCLTCHSSIYLCPALVSCHVLHLHIHFTNSRCRYWYPHSLLCGKC